MTAHCSLHKPRCTVGEFAEVVETAEMDAALLGYLVVEQNHFIQFDEVAHCRKPIVAKQAIHEVQGLYSRKVRRTGRKGLEF